VKYWDEFGEEIGKERGAESARQRSQETVFGRPELLNTYRGVLVREALYHEQPWYGILDDMESGIQAEFGMERLHKIIDEMREDVHEYLIGGAFLGYHRHYHLLFGWGYEVPAAYDGTEFDDVRCTGFVVNSLPRELRDRLPEGKSEMV
jgi:hypothetical protein